MNPLKSPILLASASLVGAAPRAGAVRPPLDRHARAIPKVEF